jgi:hypothetical protein
MDTAMSGLRLHIKQLGAVIGVMCRPTTSGKFSAIYSAFSSPDIIVLYRPLLSSSSVDDPWRPIKALAPEFGSTTTLIIIVSQKINYLEKSLDPIFPAEDSTTFEDDPRTFYINLSGPGTVLGCVDRTEWRYQAANTSWTPLSHLPTK